MTDGARRRERAFRKAYAHSRHVRWLRFLVPFIAVAGLGLAIAWSVFNPMRLLNVPVSIQGVTFDGSRLTMEQPRMSGYTRDGRAYKVHSFSAQQDLAHPTQVDLNKLVAEITLEDGSIATLVADNGHLDTKASTILLKNQVRVTTTNGHAVSTEEALVDTHDNSVVAPQAVELSSPTGAMRADRMTLADRGKTMLFEGQVRGWFIPSPPEDAAKAPAQVPPPPIEGLAPRPGADAPPKP